MKLSILFGAIALGCLLIMIVCKVSLHQYSFQTNPDQETALFMTLFLVPIIFIIFFIGILMCMVNICIGVLPMIKEKKFLLKQELIVLGSTLAIIIGYIITYLV